MEKALESSSEVVVEDGVDDWVEETVDVAEPDEEREENGVEAADKVGKGRDGREKEGMDGRERIIQVEG